MEFVINFDFFQDLDTIEKSRKTQIRKNEYFSLFLPLLLAIIFLRSSTFCEYMEN